MPLAKLNISLQNSDQIIEVLFNPAEYIITTKAVYDPFTETTEILNVKSKTLEMELFFNNVNPFFELVLEKFMNIIPMGKLEDCSATVSLKWNNQNCIFTAGLREKNNIENWLLGSLKEYVTKLDGDGNPCRAFISTKFFELDQVTTVGDTPPTQTIFFLHPAEFIPLNINTMQIKTNKIIWYRIYYEVPSSSEYITNPIGPGNKPGYNIGGSLWNFNNYILNFEMELFLSDIEEIKSISQFYAKLLKKYKTGVGENFKLTKCRIIGKDYVEPEKTWYLVKMVERYIKFNNNGEPIRARLHLTFRETEALSNY